MDLVDDQEPAGVLSPTYRAPWFTKMRVSESASSTATAACRVTRPSMRKLQPFSPFFVGLLAVFRAIVRRFAAVISPFRRSVSLREATD